MHVCEHFQSVPNNFSTPCGIYLYEMMKRKKNFRIIIIIIVVYTHNFQHITHNM